MSVACAAGGVIYAATAADNRQRAVGADNAAKPQPVAPSTRPQPQTIDNAPQAQTTCEAQLLAEGKNLGRLLSLHRQPQLRRLEGDRVDLR